MQFPLSMKPLAFAVTLFCAWGNASAAPPSAANLARLVQQLNQRMERLEQRNAELERELLSSRTQQDQPQASPAAEIEKRVQTLEANQTRVIKGLESDTISENEPELTSRLKAIEMQSLDMLSAARKVSAFDGITAGLSLTTVAQKPFGTSGTNSQLNYRGDAFVDLPLTPVGDIQHRFFAQFRVGQGGGLGASLPSYSNPNASAFQMQGGLRPDDSVALLAQAWYQANIPLPFGGFKPRSKQSLEVNFGKMDPFVFFDQNAAAADETRQFLNSAFVHNPLLDAGGDIGVDANGFAPGFRLSYHNFENKPETWRLSLGAFGSGEKGANYERSLSTPLVILQAETEQLNFGGLIGNYRLYAWRNPQGAHFNGTGPEQHSGWGISADQRVGDGITLFGRYGHQFQGHVNFDHALTLGAEVNGTYWNRSGDSIGLAAGLLKSSRDYREFTANGANERVGELYYRYRINKQFELSPHFQYIENPGGDSSADSVKILGLRAQLTY
jgi:high affinity Mn2+ porin